MLSATHSCMKEVRDTLADFEQQSRLHIDYEKSVVCPLGHTEVVNYSYIFQNKLKWLKHNEPFKYLGLSLSCNKFGNIIEEGNWMFVWKQLLNATKKLRYGFTSLLGKILIVKTMLALQTV